MLLPVDNAPNAALEPGPRPETATAVRQGLAAIERLPRRRVGRLHAPPHG